jgi:hypothetical protein
MKKIAYTRPDGGISIIIPAPKANVEALLGPLTDAQYEAHVREKSIPLDAIEPVYINDEDIPSTREYRLGWTMKNGKITVDIEKHNTLVDSQAVAFKGQ